MIDLINSIKLKSIIPKDYIAKFDRDSVDSNTEINLKFNTELMEPVNGDIERVKLVFKATAEAYTADEKIFSLELTVDYIFEIVNKDIFDKLHGEEQSVLCSSICFLEFRKRLLNAMSNTGMSGLKLPLSLQELQNHEE